jgi:hypothetical protein
METPLTFSCPLAMLLLVAIPRAGMAQTEPANAGSPAASVTAQPDYHPSFGDLMTMAVQPRHIKLGLAGKQRNWTYAAYELSELRNAFARIARTIPKYQSVDTAELMTAVVKAPLDAMDQAIMKGDLLQFTAAYAQLTNACNACHRSLKHAAVVIKVPDTSLYPGQDFRRQSQ